MVQLNHLGWKNKGWWKQPYGGFEDSLFYVQIFPLPRFTVWDGYEDEPTRILGECI